MFTGCEPALLFNMEHWIDRQGKEQSLLQEITNGIIHLINELGSIHQNRTEQCVHNAVESKNTTFLASYFFPYSIPSYAVYL